MNVLISFFSFTTIYPTMVVILIVEISVRMVVVHVEQE